MTKTVKHDDNWIKININIPSCTVVITGEGLENFKSIILPKIISRENHYFAKRNREKNDPQSTASSTSTDQAQKLINDLGEIDLKTKSNK